MTGRGTSDDEARALLDLLIPGSGSRWPPASAAIDLDVLSGRLGQDAPAFAALAREVLRHPPDQREASLRGRESGEPAAFSRLLGAIYDAYYGSPSVQAAIRTLSEASPREISASVDPGLVAAVSRGARGARRL